MFEVKYAGFLQTVRRTFPTYCRALQWVRQIGKEREATIVKVLGARNHVQ